MTVDRKKSLDHARIDQWLAEDIGSGDVTTDAILGSERVLQATWVAKAQGVVAGLAEAQAIFTRLDPALDWLPRVADGASVAPGDTLVVFSGTARAVLSGERTALNIAQRMSGIATETSQYVAAVGGVATRILDTRKTAPGMRDLDKAAVAIGGATNHRHGLHDLAMIKDNHIAAAGSIRAAVAAVRAAAPTMPIEVETTSLAELDEALAAGCDYIMLDNMSCETMKAAVALTAGRARLEASGNITRERVAEIAATGVDFISIGALTHSVAAFDISQRLS